MNRFLAASLVVLALGACNPQTSVPTIHIAVSPDAQLVSEAIAKCMPTNTDVSLSIQMRYLSSVDLSDFDLFVRLGEPSQGSNFAAQIAWEKIDLAVNIGNSVDISRETAANLFGGRIQNWSELSGDDAAVGLLAGPDSDEARQAFQAEVLLGAPVSGNTQIITNLDDALEAVVNDPGAVAILPAAWIDDTVKQIDLEIQVPVIAMAPKEPIGIARDLLACLQGPIGQMELSKNYSTFR